MRCRHPSSFGAAVVVVEAAVAVEAAVVVEAAVEVGRAAVEVGRAAVEVGRATVGVKTAPVGVGVATRFSTSHLGAKSRIYNGKQVGTIVNVCATRALMRLRNRDGKKNS